MKYFPNFFLIIVFLNYSNIFSKKVYIEYNEEFDYIQKDGKYYFPITEDLLPIKMKNLRSQTNLRKTEETKKEAEGEDPCAEQMVTGSTYWFYMFMVALLTLFAGMMSGLTVGYLSVDQLTMELRENTGTEEEKAASKVILPVLSNRHWLLCTLLLMNSFAMEALPVFLDRIFSRLTAVIISVTLLLIFGEVIPQALCTGPRQVQIAALAAPMTRFLMIISWPITFWLGKCLDIILGEQGKTRYQNQDLKCLVEMQISALEIKEKKVVEIMININDIYAIKFEEPIDKKKVAEILEKGFSRIPVFRNDDKNDLVGILRIKQLIKVDFNLRKSLKELGIRLKNPIVIPPTMTLVNLLREFRGGKSHMAFITEQVELLQYKLGLTRNNSLAFNMTYNETFAESNKIKILGIVTLEDVIEQIFNLEIMDEEDYEKSKRQKGAVRMGSNLRSPSMIAFYTNPEARGTFIKETANEIKGIIKGLKNNVEMKEKIMDKIDKNNDDKKESLLNEQQK